MSFVNADFKQEYMTYQLSPDQSVFRQEMDVGYTPNNGMDTCSQDAFQDVKYENYDDLDRERSPCSDAAGAVGEQCLDNEKSGGRMPDGDGGSRRSKAKKDKKICLVCGDKALGYNFDAISCESCKAFFRRNALKSEHSFKCPYEENCKMDVSNRRFCKKCRLRKCFAVGMKKEFILSEEEKLRKRKLIEDNRKHREFEQKHRSVGSEDPMERLSPGNGGTTSPTGSNSSPGRIHTSGGSFSGSDASSLILSPGGGGSTTDQMSPHGASDQVFTTSPPPPAPSFMPTAGPYSHSHHTVSTPPIAQTYSEETYLLQGTSPFSALSLDAANAATGHVPVSPQSNLSSPLSHHPHHHPHHQQQQQPLETPFQPQMAASMDYSSGMVAVPVAAESSPYQDNSVTSTIGSPPQSRHVLKRLNQEDQELYNEVIAAYYNALNAKQSKTIAKPAKIKDFTDIVNVSEISVHRVISMAKKLKLFMELNGQDQIGLIKGGAIELLVLRSALSFRRDTNCFLDPKDIYERNAMSIDELKNAEAATGIAPDTFEDHMRFIKSLHQDERVDNNALIILLTISLFSDDRPELIDKAKVSQIQQKYADLLEHYLQTFIPEDEVNKIYPDLLMKLSALREINVQLSNAINKLETDKLSLLMMELLFMDDQPLSPTPTPPPHHHPPTTVPQLQ